ncbi:hypothetical protein ACFVYE_37385, partial [Streptomyces sp. NPDC058239]
VRYRLLGLPMSPENDLAPPESGDRGGAAVGGTRLGLGRTDRGRERFGVALYVDFAARDGDWAAYRKGWN